MRGLFVTATDTGVGKTILSAALLAALSARGTAVRAHKPVVTGLEDPGEILARGHWPPDHELLAAVAGMDAEEVSPLRYGPALSPHLAAELAGDELEPAQLIAAARRAAPPSSGGKDADDGSGGALIVEGVGGLLAPLAHDFTVCDLASALALPILIAARPGLGTINHSLLTVRAARAAGLDVRAVVLTPWPEQPSVMERSNRETIARLGEVPVATLGHVASPGAEDLARAGAPLAELL